MALTESQNASRQAWAPLAGLTGHVRNWLKDSGDRSLAQKIAGGAFLIRVFSAGLIYLSQILLARWMGSFEFGIYVYVWTLVAVIGDLSDLGFATSAQRFVPEYAKRGAFDLLRGFLSRSRWVAVGSASVIAAVGILAVNVLAPYLPSYLVLPLSIAGATLPFYGLMQMQDGIARSYNWIHVALLPPYVVRHLIMLTIVSAAYLLNFPATAETAVIAVAVALMLTVIGQTFVLNRKLARAVPPRAEGLRGQDLALGLAADPDRRGLLSAAHQRRHRHAAALPLARRRRGLLRRRQDAGADQLSCISPCPRRWAIASASITSPRIMIG